MSKQTLRINMSPADVQLACVAYCLNRHGIERCGTFEFTIYQVPDATGKVLNNTRVEVVIDTDTTVRSKS